MLSWETEVLGENLPQCHFVHYKFHMTWPGIESGCRGGKPATNCLGYGTACSTVCNISLSSMEKKKTFPKKKSSSMCSQKPEKQTCNNCNMLVFRWRFNTQARWPHLVGCQQFVIQCICNHSQHTVPSIRSRRVHQAAVTRDPPNMEPFLLCSGLLIN
jgi:hypothetical protein